MMEPIALTLPGSAERGCTFAGGLMDVPTELLDAYAVVVVHGEAGLRLVRTGRGRVRGLDAAVADVERRRPETLSDAVRAEAARRPLSEAQAQLLAGLEAAALEGLEDPAVGRHVAAGMLLLLLALELR